MDGTYVNAEPLQVFEWNRADEITHAIVTAIAQERDSEPDAMPPLHSAIDGDALKSLFDHGSQMRDSVGRSVQFVFQGFRVHIQGDGTGYLYDGGCS